MKFTYLKEVYSVEIVQAIEWLNKMGIKNYSFDSNGAVNVDGDASLFNKHITSLPVKFGQVAGNFEIGNNYLRNLNGCPEIVLGDFYCSYNLIESLEGCPRVVSGYFVFTPQSGRTIAKIQATTFTKEDIASRCKVGGKIYV